MSSPDKTFSEMTLEELKAEYAKWDLKVRAASTWGSAMALAESQRSKVEAEIAWRNSNARP